MDSQRTRSFVDGMWDEAIVPALVEYIRIPNQSPAFDPDWEVHGHMDRAVTLAETWARAHAPESATLEVWRLPGRTPLLFVDIPGSLPGTILLYGHLDKQPPMTGWSEGRAPWTPVMRDGRLYGRGGADDGYAVFASIAAARALVEQGEAHPRLAVVIECSEESGSLDLPAYIDAYADRIGAPELVAYMQGHLTLPDAISSAKAASRQYAKRQRTWLRRRMGGWQGLTPA